CSKVLQPSLAYKDSLCGVKRNNSSKLDALLPRWPSSKAQMRSPHRDELKAPTRRTTKVSDACGSVSLPGWLPSLQANSLWIRRQSLLEDDPVLPPPAADAPFVASYPKDLDSRNDHAAIWQL